MLRPASGDDAFVYRLRAPYRRLQPRVFGVMLIRREAAVS